MAIRHKHRTTAASNRSEATTVKTVNSLRQQMHRTFPKRLDDRWVTLQTLIGESSRTPQYGVITIMSMCPKCIVKKITNKSKPSLLKVSEENLYDLVYFGRLARTIRRPVDLAVDPIVKPPPALGVAIDGAPPKLLVAAAEPKFWIGADCAPKVLLVG